MPPPGSRRPICCPPLQLLHATPGEDLHQRLLLAAQVSAGWRLLSAASKLPHSAHSGLENILRNRPSLAFTRCGWPRVHRQAPPVHPHACSPPPVHLQCLHAGPPPTPPSSSASRLAAASAGRPPTGSARAWATHRRELSRSAGPSDARGLFKQIAAGGKAPAAAGAAPLTPPAPLPPAGPCRAAACRCTTSPHPAAGARSTPPLVPPAAGGHARLFGW